ncbi:MAG: hypothetical protein LBT86_06920 [Deltaproteobacteria bacterium]|nr:hypothetical protein [Deltaproteobacteria bacterium]
MASYLASVDSVTAGPPLVIPAPLTEKLVKLQTKAQQSIPKEALFVLLSFPGALPFGPWGHEPDQPWLKRGFVDLLGRARFSLMT